MYHTLEPNYLYHNYPDRNFVYFGVLTHACMAVYKIYKRFGLDMGELNIFFRDLFGDGTVIHNVTDGFASATAEAEMKEFIAHVLCLTDRDRQ